MVPFQRHTANVEELETSAESLSTLADEARTHYRTTHQTYQPVVNSWNGIGEVEAETADQPLRQDSDVAAVALAWAAVAAQYWAGEVRSFNNKVDAITSQGPNFGATGEDGEPPSEDAIGTARNAAMRQWWEAYNLHILDGEDRVEGMLRDGPTGYWLAELRRAGMQVQPGDGDGEGEGDGNGDDGPVVFNEDGFEITLFESEHEKNLWEREGKGEVTLFDRLKLAGEWAAKVLGFRSETGLTFNQDGLVAQAAASAYLLSANAKGSTTIGDVELRGGGDVFLGGLAGANASITKDGVQAGAEAMVGGRAGLEGQFEDVGGLTGSGRAEAIVGFGAEAGFTAGRTDDGGWQIGGNLGVAFMFGGSVEWNLEINPGTVQDTIADGAEAIGDVAGDLGGGAVDAVGGALDSVNPF